MIKTIKAAWKVWRNKDINSVEKPVKVKPRTEEEIATHIAFLEKLRDEATARGEPFIAIGDITVDYTSLSSGSFSFIWNDLFLARCMKRGYQGNVDHDLVDQWFTAVCRNVVLETYEQHAADPKNRAVDLGGGRREYK
jgi:hypothetical protein